ncbi:unnamed protein product [Sordaria macrospora k-hell]|uniref:WGS project CABT00000000 data, contig 2.28 n=2 Tax=Sordaria macrospora TaxID=5147 RepID=F7W4K6_SORMK|nr:uncharacterized protein SMAC_06523 [Sordaria macrospora k-hell]KAH7633178.1 hypothetical protein B0T09DRAFT_395409 [Sordaria sp. MPI-SDFR-AT-0083]CCC12443.1 unnamed protein product [Sordaria macrospora k-hell]
MSNLHYNWAGSSGILGVLKAISHGRAIPVSLGRCLYYLCSVHFAFGFDVVNCTQTRAEAYDYGYHYLPEKIRDDQQSEKRLMFESWVGISNGGNSGISLVVATSRKDSSGCTGNILNHTCYLSPSAMLYDNSLQGEIATLRSKSWRDDSLAESVSFYADSVGNEVSSGTIWLPLYQIGRLLFTSSAWVTYSFGFYQHLYNEGLIANLYAANWSSTDPNDGCAQHFHDPMDCIINSYRDIAFRMSVRSAADPIYDSMALILATLVGLAGPLPTLVLFWGWWKLGRDFTTSPLELANAILQPQQPRFELGASGGMAEQNKTVTEETLTAVGYTSSSGEGYPYYRHQCGGQHLASVFTSCSGNASADRLAEHFRCLGRTGNTDSVVNEGEPMVQYHTVQSDAGERLGFAVVSGPQGADALHHPKNGWLF